MAKAVFISYVGKQIMGVENTLNALIASGNFDISHVVLLGTDKTKVEIEKIGSAGLKVEKITLDGKNSFTDVFDEKLKEYEVIFNIDGGLNYKISQAVAKYYDQNLILVTTCRENVFAFNLSDKYSASKLSLPSRFSVKELLQKQGLELRKQSSCGKITNYCKNKKIRISSSCEQDAEVNGIKFDFIFNDGSNRLVFLADCTKSNAVYDENERKQKLKQIREFCSISGTKNAFKNLYDRRVVVLCSTELDKAHIRYESRGKAETFDICGEFIDNYPFFIKNNKYKGSYLNLDTELNEFLSAKAWEDKEKASFVGRKVHEDSLVVSLGNDTAPTLSAIKAHKKAHNIKNVILITTADSYIQRTAQDIKDFYASEGIKVSIFISDIAMSTFMQKKIGLSCDKNAANVHVNITPGSKSQTAALTYWAKLYGARIWSINHQNLSNIEDNSNICNAVKAEDALLQLRIMFPKNDNFKDSERFIESSDNFLKNKEFNKLMLKLMREACETDQEYVFDKWSDFKSRNKEYRIGAYSLNRQTIAKDPQSDDSLYCEMVEIEGPDHNIYTSKFEGGFWLEDLVAQALEESGAENVHQGTRIYFDDDKFLVDMDVLASWQEVHVLISCKAKQLGADKQTNTKDVLAEADSMASSLDRYTLPIVCYLSKLPKDKLNETDKEDYEKILDWKIFCQPQKLAAFINNFRRSKSTVK